MRRRSDTQRTEPVRPTDEDAASVRAAGSAAPRSRQGQDEETSPPSHERPDDPALHALAVAAGAEVTYQDGTGAWRTASDAALRQVLGALGLPADTPRAARDSLAGLRRARVRPGVTDVLVAWDGDPLRVRVRVPPEERDRVLGLRILFEDGGERDWDHRPEPASAVSLHAEGAHSVAYDIEVPGGLPYGYHTLEVRIGEDVHRAHLISAPREAPRTEAPEWGVFVPTYALNRREGFGIGDLSDLARVATWTQEQGGSIVATLPLLDQFIGGPIHDPSPYAPISRRFWNGLLVDPTAEPEYDHADVRAVWDTPRFRARLEEVRQGARVDHAAVWALKEQLFAAMAAVLEARETPRRRAFRAYLRQHPDLWRYARFRAATERHGPWHGWPEEAAAGDLSHLQVDDEVVQMHAYIQWVADRQVARVADAVEDASDETSDGMRLHLDLPLGAHPDGYDVWNDRAAYARGIETGAPPDGFFEKGQKWGFSPLNPRRLRQSGYRHFAACIRKHLSHATLLRIDHVMSLHRLFWVPTGFDATDGVYVHYPHEELYAVVLLEAHRAGALVVGEDLGTVPKGVHEAMDRHHLHRTYVLQLQVRSRGDNPPVPPPNALATLNTHDMVPFTAWWRGDDIEQRIRRGFVEEDEANDARAKREVTKARIMRGLSRHGEPSAKSAEDVARWRGAGARTVDEAAPDPPPPLPAGRGGPDQTPTTQGLPVDIDEARDRALRFLFRGPAPLVVVNLEDLWFETEPQNQPGFPPDTPEGRKNWARRIRHDMETLVSDPTLSASLQSLDRLRPRRHGGTRT